MKNKLPTVADLAAYDCVIDVRSPAEFAEDHIPGAINCPVLDDEQRARVGTIYKQVSPFEAKKIGAALISANIARHLEGLFLEQPKNWRPLIYCWRGGMRSGSMTTVFRSIGWNAGQLEGGYKAWRRHVIDELERLPASLDFRVVCGATGSGKTRILQAIGAHGEQILDLETLASHKGSVLGILPDQPQPPQKWFETQLLQALQGFDPSRPVYVEAESRKVGNLHVPEALMQRIRAGRCLQIDACLPARVDFLLADYDYFLSRQELLLRRLHALQGLQSNENLQRWSGYVAAGHWRQLVQELLELHYDPLYHRSQGHNYLGLEQASRFASDCLDPQGIDRIAAAMIASR
ncbi:tRNA 2-selenouridine(34) synthase MnmH [Dechloromonas sp. ZY10]|uniref:tRNA 2-selenouridine(34) synthase MnmH n=1 Tax=Dechloromonas aquae TaxID=2664436 RepID=UPI003526D3CF